MRLKIVERVVLVSLLPDKGTEKENETMQSIFSKVGFSNEEEIKEKEISFGENISFNPSKDGDGIDVSLTTVEKMFLLETFEKIGNAGEIKREIYPIYKELKRKLNED